MGNPADDEQRIGQIEALCDRIESKDLGATRDLFELTGRLVGPWDVKAAHGGIGLREFVRSLLLPEVESSSNMSDAELEAAIGSISRAELKEAETGRLLKVLELELDQPYISDLIFWPAREFTSREIVDLARTKKGAALAPYLDPMCKPKKEGARSAPPAKTLRAVRATLVEMVLAEEIELSSGYVADELAAALPTLSDGDALAEWLCRPQSGIGEVYADDEALGRRLADMKARAAQRSD